VNGQESSLDTFFFREKGKPERFKKVSIMGNEKAHYELHFLLPDDKCLEAEEGELWLASDWNAEPFLVTLQFVSLRFRQLRPPNLP
jgi:hypothetical protein